MQNTIRWRSDRFWYICHYSWRNNYLEPLVKRKLCKFSGLCLHSTSVVILPNCQYSEEFLNHNSEKKIVPRICKVLHIFIDPKSQNI